MIIWQFKPREPITKAPQWRTDIIRSRSAEQRFAVRQTPRVTLAYDHIFNHEEYTAARALIRQGISYYAPDWTLAVEIPAIPSGASVPVALPYDDLDLDNGDQVLLWSANNNFEQAEVENIDSSETTVTLLSVAKSRTNVFLVPLHLGRAVAGLQPSRPAGPVVNAQISFDYDDVSDIGVSDYSQYRGHDLIDDCPVVGSGEFDETIRWPVENVENIVGVPTILENRTFADEVFTMRWLRVEREDIATLRRFLYTRRGKWKSFWLSSYGKDFQLVEDIGAVDTTIRVRAPSDVIDLGVDAFDIDIYTGTHYYRQVTSYALGASVDGHPSLVFTIDSSLGTIVTTSDIISISYLRCLRFGSDRAEILYRAKAGASVAMPCIEALP